MTDPYEDLPEALYAQWERRWGTVAFLGVMIISVIAGVGAIVMYEATSPPRTHSVSPGQCAASSPVFPC